MYPWLGTSALADRIHECKYTSKNEQTQRTPAGIYLHPRLKRCTHKNQINVTSDLPRVFRARGQSQFGRPHPARSWQHRCKE